MKGIQRGAALALLVVAASGAWAAVSSQSSPTSSPAQPQMQREEIAKQRRPVARAERNTKRPAHDLLRQHDTRPGDAFYESEE